jgi:hypothetical protein
MVPTALKPTASLLHRESWPCSSCTGCSEGPAGYAMTVVEGADSKRDLEGRKVPPCQTLNEGFEGFSYSVDGFFLRTLIPSLLRGGTEGGCAVGGIAPWHTHATTRRRLLTLSRLPHTRLVSLLAITLIPLGGSTHDLRYEDC